MSRPLALLAATLFFVVGLLPIAVMGVRVVPADLAAIFDARTAGLLGRTMVLGLSSALLALAIGLPFGFLVARTDLPGAPFLRALGMVPLILPPLLLAMTWTVLTEQPGVWAAICILGMSTFPLVSLFSARAFERIDARREEAALLVGGLGAVLRMELRLVLPAALCGAALAFAFAVNDFAVPDFVTFMGRKFNVYADQIYSDWKQTESPGKAVASAIPLVLLTLSALLPALALRRQGAFATLTGDFERPRPLALGAWRWPAFLLCATVVFLTAVLPLGRLVWEAAGGPFFQRSQDAPEGLALWSAMGDRLGESFSIALDRMRTDLRNSLTYSAAAASLCVPLGLILGHALERARSTRRARLLEALSLLPLAVPAVLFGMGFLVTWNRPATHALYDGPLGAILLYTGRYAPFAILVLAGAAASVGRELEEAAALSGAGPLRRLGSVVAPTLKGPLVAAWVLVFVLAMRELDSAILVGAANKTAVFRVFNSVHFGRDSFVAAMSLLLAFLLLLPGLLWILFARRRLEFLP